jgi:hypothetical protein
MAAVLISRSDALAAARPRYFTGLTCKNGHIAERYTKNKTCCVCADAASNNVKKRNPEKYLALVAKWAKNNRSKTAVYTKAYVQRNKGLRNLWTMNYRSAKDERMPSWLNDAEQFELECVYAYCAALRQVGLDYHVDHVVPLRGQRVSGLHVPWNLQVIPGRENTRKGNVFNG